MNCAPQFRPNALPPRQALTTRETFPPILHGIKTTLLIPGRGAPIHNAAVIIHDNVIAYAGPVSAIPAKFRAVSFVDVEVLMPGLWDCHVHFFGNPTSKTENPQGMLGSQALMGARTADSFQRTLMAGFTSVREVGGYGGEVWSAVQEGTIVGPTVYSSFAAMSMTGGHGDLRKLSAEDCLTSGLQDCKTD